MNIYYTSNYIYVGKECICILTVFGGGGYCDFQFVLYTPLTPLNIFFIVNGVMFYNQPNHNNKEKNPKDTQMKETLNSTASTNFSHL